jgi:hypothetical protein
MKNAGAAEKISAVSAFLRGLWRQKCEGGQRKQHKTSFCL